MICETTAFYWLHRAVHIDGIYNIIHKQHHEYKDTVSICSEYAHPIDTLINNTIPTVIGYKLLGERTHLFSAAMWVLVRTV
jgi:sterol desaturase/sphingolipid hydroxylase (fatty acid hydroxylase superfamily)